MTTEKTFTSKLGTTRSGPRSRIWIEGKRLIAAGFTPGKAFVATWTPATVTLTLDPKGVPGPLAEFRKVSGKEGGKPIIDMVGETVHETFGKHGEHVSVTFGDGVITIRRAK